MGAAPADADRALERWADALRAAALVAVDPWGLGGVALHAGHGPVRDRWLAALRAGLPADAPWRRVPLHAGDDRLLGGLDLAATLRSGRPVAQTGLLAEGHGGLLVLAMAERVAASTAARICAALDAGTVSIARDGLSEVRDARFGVVALDERTDDDPPPPGALLERLAFRLDLHDVPLGIADALGGAAGDDPSAGEAAAAVLAARGRLAGVAIGDDVVAALCEAAMSLGADSLRAPILAVRAARAAAALDGRDAVGPDDAALAARLVLGPRATRMPAPPEDVPPETEPPPPEPPAEPSSSDAPPDDPPPPSPDVPGPAEAPAIDEVVLEAARAAIPAGLLARLRDEGTSHAGAAGGRAGGWRETRLRGRPAGVRAGSPRDGARLALIDTLRAAVPWQALRRAEAGAHLGNEPRVRVRASDLRVARLRERAETTTVFAIDASGSSALHRLAEAKGAIELLLADCYVRRDRVAVVAFRGRGAQLLLPPTRSLVRAKRSLAGLPGGGGTPLASGLQAAADLVEAALRRGGTPLLVLLTDGRANVALDGSGGRERATADARVAARRLRALRPTALLIDTSPQPQPGAAALAIEMGATYLPLPRADAAAMAAPVRAIAAVAGRGR